MIFALFIIMIFVGLLAFVQYGQQPNNELVPAQLYAQNMAVWHQAAMVAQRNDGFSPCSSPCTASLVNDSFWQNGAPGSPMPNRALKLYWGEYQPMVRISYKTGWQSWLLRKMNAETGATNGTESYMLTVFRGFSSNTPAASASGVGRERGGLSDDNFAKGLSRDITERIGIGQLRCSATPAPGQCTFTHVSSEIIPSNEMKTDRPFKFDLTVFTNGSPALYFSGTTAAKIAEDLNGRPAIMTRLDNVP